MKIFIHTKNLYTKSIKLFLFLFIPLISLAQTEPQPLINSKLNGTVIDALSKKPIPGAVVKIQGTTHAVATDDGGHFIFITGQKFPYTLVVSFIGYKTKTIIVNGSPVTVRLEENINQLSDVVVVGYGTQERKDLVHAQNTIKADEVKQQPVASFDAQLQGKAPGLQVNSNTGTPGDGVFVRVRGTTSINASNDPLYVVDGVFLNNTSLQTVSTGGRATSPIADINPADIESFEVLKDASATAIYGSRGANGVVIVTTKRGNYNDKPKINFNTTQGIAYEPKGDLWKLTTGPQHAEIVNEFYRNSNADIIAAATAAGTTPATTYLYQPFRALTDNPTKSPAPRGLPQDQQTYDRLDELFRTGLLVDYNLSVSGGSRDTKYFIAGGYTSQQADIKPISFNRGDFRVNLDQKINDFITIGVTNNISRSYRNQARAGDGPAGGLLQSALHTPTYLPENNADGTPAKWAGFDNLQVLLNNYNVHTISLRYVGNFYADIQLAKGLKFKTSWSLDYNNYNESEYWNDQTQLGTSSGTSPVNGLATSSITDNSAWINEQTLNYHTIFANKHTLDIVVGNTLQSNVTKNTFAQGSGFPNNAYTDIISASTRTASETWSKYDLASFFSRVSYNYDSKYYIEASARADGSSKFGPNNKWGYFPAVGAAWRIKEEDFLRNNNTISDLKLRVSYGITGNSNGISPFAAQGLWNGGAGYPDTPSGGDKAGTAPQQLPNPNLKWESTTQLDGGIDLGLLKNRINLTFDVYSKTTNNVLLQVPVPQITGFSTVWSNAGKVTNKGYELGINSRNFKTASFSWQTSFNISGNVNKVVTLPAPISEYSRDWIRLQQGYSMYSFWMYKQLYVDPQTGNSVFQHADGTSGTSVTVADRQIIGNALPKFFGGLTNNFTYKAFDAGILFSYQYGNKILNLNRFFGEGGGTRDAARVIFASQLNRWTTPGQITDVPRVTAIGNNYTLDQNSRFLEDGSFIRLKSLTLGYTLPKSISQKIDIQSLRIYFVGTNLLLFTKYTGPDPEANVSAVSQTQGLDLGTPPQPHTLQLGINITL
ncbi:SusC/RagA family TonB-linked outer membrane protein [Mucilaginibacter paludis]|uniref:TonB-dependent receptor n=1 Tax=Mucilaginibacter paludis DSM 18603 TaxID=714943 RepID=H1Y379_9SPHI|nr:TonB-dependent receptor [Mucilaginibacter paludis]EHQ28897.1 TonB-dependent receptor [Mucilaginibacter paludis DSM 18603]